MASGNGRKCNARAVVTNNMTASASKIMGTARGDEYGTALAQKAAGVVGVTSNDLRGTAVTRLAIAQCTEAEIATITGHSLRGVNAILDTHYLGRDQALGESAIRKLERGTKTPN